MKKVLSLVLVIAMVLSSMSFAFAGTFEDVVDTDYEKAINTLAGLGIITGYEDGTFRPERVVTRAEMAKLMVEILGYGDLVAGAKSNFSDTQGHWADQWIAIAAGRNIVIGTGDGKFTPDRTVSYDEVLTMIVRGLGYTDDSNEIKSMTWPTNFKVKAAELGVTDGVKMATAGADRGGVAQALFNALDATLVSVDNEGNVRYLQDNKQRDLPLITRIAVVKGDEDDPFEVLPKHLDPNDRAYAGDIVDLTPYLYEHVEAYASKSDNDIIVYVAESFSDTVEGTFETNKASDAYVTNRKFNVEEADGSVEILDLSTTSGKVRVYYNGKEVRMNEEELEQGSGTIAGLGTTEVANVKVVLKDTGLYANSDNDYNGDVRAIVVTNPTYVQKVVAGYKDDALKLGRIQLPKKGDNVDLSKVTVTGAVDDIKDIEADDVVVAYAAGGTDNSVVPSKVELVVVRDAVEGTITRVNKANTGDVTTIYVDDVKYTRSEINGSIETYDVGYEGTFFLDDSGRIVAQDSTDIASAKDYAVVIERFNGVKSATTTGRTLANAEIKLINASGEVVTYAVDKDAEYTDGSPVLDDTLAIVADDNGTGDLLTSKTLIKYKLDGSVIDTIEIVKLVADAGNGKNVETDNFPIAKDAPIFNIKAQNVDSDGDPIAPILDYTNKDNYSVVNVKDLPKIINIKYSEYTDSGDYKVIVSNDADRSTSGTFALITAVDFVMDGTKRVPEVTAYVDGQKITYIGKNDKDDSNYNLITANTDYINKGRIVEFELSGGKLDEVNTVGAITITTPQAISSANNARIVLRAQSGVRADDMGTRELDIDNVVVYVLKSDNKFDYVEETIGNIRGLDVFGLYDTNGDGDIDIIVVK